MLRIQEPAHTFDDLLIVPRYSNILPTQVNLDTYLTADIKLHNPIISAAMDTVTEAKLAIAMAHNGGIGIIHKNMSPAQQAHQIQLVKKHENGVVSHPITIDISATLAELIALTRHHAVYSVPVVDENSLVGIITSRDIVFQENTKTKITKLMTPKEKLITVSEGTDHEEIKKLLQQHSIEQVLVVNDNFELRGMVTAKDINTRSDHPYACKDSLGRLRVGAAIGVGAKSLDRLKELVAADLDVVAIDTAHGHSQGVIDTVKQVRQLYPSLAIIAGNIATADAAQALAKAGADAVKVGIGPGSICTTRVVTGVGVPQLTAVANVAHALKDTKVKVIADGGIRFSGDIAKALVAGANAVMLGGMLAGTDEAPGDVELYQGRSYKNYRGMGSIGAMNQQHGSSDRYFQDSKKADKLVPEGIEGRVPCKGPVIDVLEQILGGIRASMGYAGCASIQELNSKAEFVSITRAGVAESHPHDVAITKESPNYNI